MTSIATSASQSRAAVWSGRAVSGVVVLFMTTDAVAHLLRPEPVVAAFAALALPLQLSATIGVLALVCTALYAIPRTALLGAVLLTGYLGGAVAIQVRAGKPAFEVLFPIMVGVLLWGGLLLRDRALRSLFPMRG